MPIWEAGLVSDQVVLLKGGGSASVLSGMP